MNNKKIKNACKIFLILITYIFMCFLENISFLKGGVNDIIFINKTLFISLLILLCIVFFSEKLFNKKIFFWIIYCTLLFYNLAEGYFDNFSSFPFLIMYLYLLLSTFTLIIKSQKDFEISIITAFSIILLISLCFGMLTILKFLKYILLLSAILMIFYIFKSYKKDKQKVIDSKNKLFDSGFIIFNILWIISVLGGAGMYVHIYDEYSHWAYDAKATIYYSKISTSQEIMSRSRAYPPLFTMWHYIISIFSGFNEHNLYVGIATFSTIYLMPAFYYIKNNHLIMKIFAFIAIVFGGSLFGGVYNYLNLYADLPISIMFSSSIILFYIYKDKNIDIRNNIALLLVILTLSKTNGFVISLITLLIMILIELIEIKKYNLKSLINFTKSFYTKYKKIIYCILISIVLWKSYFLICNKLTVDYYDFSLLSDSLKPDLKYKLNNSFLYKFFGNLYLSFDRNIFSGLINFNLYQFIIFLFSIIFIVFVMNEKSYKNALNHTLIIIFTYFLFFIITLLSIFYAMTGYEASSLASFGRYLNWFHSGIFIFIISYLLRADNKKIIFKYIIILFFVLSISYKSILFFVYSPIRKESYDAYAERTKKFEIVRKNTSKDAFVYVIDQKDTDGIMAMWYARYYMFPRKCNASASAINWKIITNNNKEDLGGWGLTSEKWKDNLIKYNFDYVYLYSKDDEFFNETSNFYEDVNIAKKYNLFKIEKTKNSFKLIPIK